MGDLWGWASQDVQELGRLRRFVQIELPAHGTVSTTTSITIPRDSPVMIRGSMTGDAGHRDFGPRVKGHGFRFADKDVVILRVLQVIAACPTLTHLTLRFEFLSLQFESPVWHDFNALVAQIFSVLRPSHSLFHLTFSICESLVQKRAETVTLDRCRRDFVWNPLSALLGPLTTTVPSEAILGIKRLVLNTFGLSNGWRGCEFDDVVDLVSRNTTLEILEVGPSICERRYTFPCGMGRALECNRTLKEIRFQLGSVADFEQLVVHLVPDANGHQANTTLSTLELSLLPFHESPLDYLPDLAKLVAFNSTLTDVRISRELEFRHDSAERKFSIQKTMVEVWKLRGELERMVENELRRNTSLRSLSVGEWEVHRGNGTQEWQMTYSGPCLARELGECLPALTIWLKAFVGSCWWWLLWMMPHV